MRRGRERGRRFAPVPFDHHLSDQRRASWQVSGHGFDSRATGLLGRSRVAHRVQLRCHVGDTQVVGGRVTDAGGDSVGPAGRDVRWWSSSIPRSPGSRSPLGRPSGRCPSRLSPIGVAIATMSSATTGQIGRCVCSSPREGSSLGVMAPSSLSLVPSVENLLSDEPTLRVASRESVPTRTGRWCHSPQRSGARGTNGRQVGPVLSFRRGDARRDGRCRRGRSAAAAPRDPGPRRLNRTESG